jgi:hypothetical protein
MQQRGLGILVELHPLAEQMARLLSAFFDGAQEIEATSDELTRAGMPSIDWPLPELARHLNCAVDDLPQISGWNLHGYYPGPALPPERLLGRAKELLSKGKK